MAQKRNVGFILCSLTYRSSTNWGEKLGYSAKAIEDANYKAIELLQKVRREFETPKSKMVISGCLGPRGDA